MFLGLGIGTLVADDSAEIRAATAARDLADARAARITAERDRLRAERDQLEARLAAGKTPAVCPREYVSTARLLRLFAVDYPCGWHVVAEAAAPAGDRHGLLVELTLISSVPVSLEPRAGSLADVEVAQWSDDPADDTDALPPVATWVEQERARFTQPPVESRFEGGSGVSVTTLSGMLGGDEESVRAVVALWGYIDPQDGARHVVRVVALNPSARARRAVDRVARSFSVFAR